MLYITIGTLIVLIFGANPAFLIRPFGAPSPREKGFHTIINSDLSNGLPYYPYREGYFLKKLIIFLLCFTLLAVGVTYGCIQYTLRTPSAEDLPAEAGIDLNGYYDENDLLITQVEEVIASDTGDVFLSYPQIDGLKNEEVQTAVNDRIRTEAERMKNQYAEQGTNLQYLSCNVSANFANVLSVGLFSGDDAANYEQMYLNFNLNDGSLLEFRDLFRADADLNFIVHSAFYDALTRNNLYQTYGEAAGYPDENELYKTVKAYLNGPQSFAFSPSEIYLYCDDYAATLPMTKFAEDITVYSKYLGDESLFVNDDIGCDGVFTCVQLPYSYEVRELGMVEERFWYDIAMSEPYFDEQISMQVQEDFQAFSEELIASLLDEAEQLRTAVQQQSDKAYVLLAEPQLYLYRDSEQVGNEWIETPSRAVEVNMNYSLYEMDAELFASKYRRELVELYRSGTYSIFYTGMDQVIDRSEVQVTKDNTVTLYDYKTGEVMTLDDVFADDFDYMDAVIRQAKYDLVGYYYYTAESAEESLRNARVELAGSSVRVYLPEWGTEQYLVIAFSQFPRSAFAIFD